MTYEEIMYMVCVACKRCFYSGYKNNYAEVIQATTQIYIKQMELEKNENTKRDCQENQTGQ